MAKMITVNEVKDLLCVSESTAYKIIRGLNAELKEKGYLTITGKIPADFVKKRYGLFDNE